jgi:hypothetical protein
MWQLKSPAGTYEITLAEREVFNTHWLHVPSLRDVHTGETFLALSEEWSLDESAWQTDSVVTLRLRKYPGNHTPPDVVAIVDCAERTATVGEGASGPLADLEQRLDAVLTWIYAKPQPPAELPGLLGALRRIFKG